MTALAHVLGLFLALIVFLGLPLIVAWLGLSVIHQRARRAWQLAANAIFVGLVLVALALISGFLMFFTAGAGRNTIRLEGGSRVADYGFPFRFATGTVDGWPPYRLGDDAAFNPLEFPTTFDTAPFWLAWGFWFLVTVFAAFSLAALIRRSIRARLLRPSARPS
jgi:small neutral amino acid transporter SnatA (MarC family)